ncbi:MAG: cytidine deaminase [Petrimonas sp.]|nr:cytidine deaminase [Petrimonas sp.]
MKEINLTAKISVYRLEECSEIEKKLIEAAKKATQQAYAPYSHFRVGAAVLLENGVIVSGNNQENAAFPSSLCAERTTVFFVNANHPDQKIMTIAIAAFHNGAFTKEVITPCGACRQVLLEVENRFNTPMKVMMYSEDGIYVADSIKDLLPMSFGDNMLG